MQFVYVFPLLVLFLDPALADHAAGIGLQPAAPLILAAVGAGWALLIAVTALLSHLIRRRWERACASATSITARESRRAKLLRQHALLIRAALIAALAGYFVAVHLGHWTQVAIAWPFLLREVALLLPAYLVLLSLRWAAFPALRSLTDLLCLTGEYLRFQVRVALVLPPPRSSGSSRFTHSSSKSRRSNAFSIRFRASSCRSPHCC